MDHNEEESDESTFIHAAEGMMKTSVGFRHMEKGRRFRSLFGITPRACAIVWDLIGPQKPKGLPKHFLWVMLFLKVCATEAVNSILAGVDENTFRKWVGFSFVVWHILMF